MVLNFDETILKDFPSTIQIKIIVPVKFQGDNVPVLFQRDGRGQLCLEQLSQVNINASS
jgi:hypothetical protein